MRALDPVLRQLTLANQLTLLRLAAIPAFALLMLEGETGWALVVYLGAAITDRLDGIAARRLGQFTPLGAFLDPAADKLMMLVTYVLLALPDHPRTFPQFALEPQPRHRPIARCLAPRHAEHVRGLLLGQAGEEAKFDQPRHPRVPGGEFLERAVQVEHIGRNVVPRQAGVQRDALPVPAALVRVTPPGMIDQHLAHRARGRAEEVGAAFPADAVGVDETNVGFVDQGGGLKRVAGALAAQLPLREAAQFIVDGGEEFLRLLRIGPIELAKDPGDRVFRISHGCGQFLREFGSAPSIQHPRRRAYPVVIQWVAESWRVSTRFCA